MDCSLYLLTTVTMGADLTWRSIGSLPEFFFGLRVARLSQHSHPHRARTAAIVNSRLWNCFVLASKAKVRHCCYAPSIVSLQQRSRLHGGSPELSGDSEALSPKGDAHENLERARVLPSGS
jgi:hypothetical protein